jgi:AcrR family transcriptional regulator
MSIPDKPRPESSSEERRDRVARAAWAVIARDGLDRASMRAIAQELGTTTGVLTHYFRDKDALLAFVLEAIIAELNLDRLDPSDPTVKVPDLVRLLAQFLPRDDESRASWRVWLSFTVASLADDSQSDRHRGLYARLREMWTQQFRNMQARGALRADLDPSIEADTILSLIDGVGVQALISPDAMTADRQLAIVKAYLDKLI